MKELFIDCEFNGFGGDLLSMGIVDIDSTENGEFYRELRFTGQIDPWVNEHVIPLMADIEVSKEKFQADLQAYLSQFKDGFTLIADWPDDLRYFMESIIIGPGLMMPLPSFKCEMNRSLSSSKSVKPHHALYDAIAIRDQYVWSLLVPKMTGEI